MAIKILHCINDLFPGGAEFALRRLITNSDASTMQHAVISLTDLEVSENILADINIPIYQLHLNRKFPNPLTLFKIKQIIRDENPDIFHTWMYAGILAGSLAVRKSKIPVVWGLHHVELDPLHQKKTTTWTMKTCAHLSYSVPNKIIACGESVRKNHIAFGFDPEKVIVVPNGIDTEQFKPDPDAPSELKRELELGKEVKLVGIASRFHPIKDHANFLQAAGIVARQRTDVHFILCGNEITPENTILVDMINQVGLDHKCHLLGRRQDMPKLLAGWDVAVSSSRSEALSNTLIEAMACGTPCVATDVGDTAYIINNYGIVVPSGNSEKLAKGILKILAFDSKALKTIKEGARQRVVEKFDVKKVNTQIESLYQAILTNR